jgi:hypothetical protein
MTHMGEMRKALKFLVEKSKRTRNLEDFDVDGRVLKLFLNK